VVHINRIFEDRLHVLLFLKHGLWRYIYEKPQEYNKFHSVIQHLSWNDEQLIEIISGRIAWRHGRAYEELDAKTLWAMEFQFDDFSSFTRQFTEVCLSGPRDMIDLCNHCAELAGDKPITLKERETVLPEYSQRKLYGIRADFGNIYSNVENFIPRVLRGADIEMNFETMAQIVERKSLLDDSVKRTYDQYPWFRLSDRERLAKLIYEVGVVGVVDLGQVVYATEDPFRQIYEEDLLIIHPAFRSALKTIL